MGGACRWGVVLNKDGSFQRSARFSWSGPRQRDASRTRRGRCVASTTPAASRFGLGDLFVEAQRHVAGVIHRQTFPDIASAMVDAERRRSSGGGAHFESTS